MGAPAKTPGKHIESLIDWRARQIGDPVQRLRFLRSATAHVSASRNSARLWKRKSWIAGAIVVITGLILVPLGKRALAGSASVPPVRFPNTRPSVAVMPKRSVSLPDQPPPRVWLVEKRQDYEVYSNGLRIETSYTTPNEPRGSFPVYRRKAANANDSESESWRTEPVGIVFHSTESRQAPFQPEETQHLKRIGQNLLDYIRQKRAYHYVVDRFGRAWRVVQESDSANHAGKSVWADTRGVYVNLNRSFIGVAIEATTEAGTMTAAQLHTTRVLTEMLRSKYAIPGSNCIPHAQVSVNPLNMRIGYHTDWAIGFPFAELDLPDNYAQPLASMYEFGFDYDDAFLARVDGSPWQGALVSDQQVKQQAAAAGLRPAQYRKRLEGRYRRILSSAATRSNEESTNETKQ